MIENKDVSAWLIKQANALTLKDIEFPVLREGETVPVVTALDGHLKKLHERNELWLPNFQESKSVAAFSDYSGEHKCDFYAYSTLFVAYDALGAFFETSHKIRQNYNLIETYPEFCFKNLRIGAMASALGEWLHLGNCIPGMLFTLLVAHDVASVIGIDNRTTTKEASKILRDEGIGDWKPTPAEKLLRIIHPLSYLTALLTKEGQGFLWMTDEDAIVANDAQREGTGKLLGKVLNIYSNHGISPTSYGLPFKDIAPESNFNDLLSYPDLVAGSIESLYTAAYRSDDPKIKSTTNEILLWLCSQGIFLQKHCMVVRKGENGGLATAIVDFKPKQPPEEITYIPIWK